MQAQCKAPFSLWCEISKVDQEKHVIGGYASVDVVDEQRDKIPLETLKEAWEHFIKDLDYAHIHVMHSNIPVGRVLLEYTDSQGKKYKSGVDDKGLFILAEIRQDIKKGRETWKLIEEGKLRGFSIAGEVLASTYVHDGRSYNRIDKLELHEISVVDRPANKLCLFTVMKALKKGGYVFRDNLLEALPDGIVLTRGIVRLVGRNAELGYGHDYDIKAPTTQEWLGRAIQTRIHNELRRKGRMDIWNSMEWITDEGEYSYTDYLDLYDLVLLRSKQSKPERLLLTEEERKGGVASLPVDKAPYIVRKVEEMSEEEITLEKVLELVADLGKRLDALEEQIAEKKKKPDAYKKPKAYKEKAESGGPSDFEKALEILAEEGIIKGEYQQCMSKCLKSGKSFKECVKECKAKAKKSEDEDLEEKAKKKPKAYKEPYPEKKEEEKAEEEKAKKPEDEEEEEEKPYKEPYPEKDLKGMIERAIEDALNKRLGGTTEVKKSVAPAKTEIKKTLMDIPLEELYKIPFSKIRKGEL